MNDSVRRVPLPSQTDDGAERSRLAGLVAGLFQLSFGGGRPFLCDVPLVNLRMCKRIIACWRCRQAIPFNVPVAALSGAVLRVRHPVRRLRRDGRRHFPDSRCIGRIAPKRRR